MAEQEITSMRAQSETNKPVRQETTATTESTASSGRSAPDSRHDRPRGEGEYGSRRDRPGSDQRSRQGSGGKRFVRRRRVDYFSVNKIDHIDYKEVEMLKQFVGDRGKINPRRRTGLSAKHQRQLRTAIKRSRNLALLPFAGNVEKSKPGGIENA